MWWISGSHVNFTFCVCENVCEFYVLVHIVRLPSIKDVFIYISTVVYKCPHFCAPGQNQMLLALKF